MADSAVAGKGLHVMQGARAGTTEECPFDPAVLVSQRYFQVINGFAVALKTKMPRLDDARVYRPHGNLMDLVPRHAEEIHDAHRRRPPPWADGVKRIGLSQGCPSGRIPHCSKISRSKPWAAEQSGVSEG